MNYDYHKRGYLLPDGCKDLIDVVKPKAEKRRTPNWTDAMPTIIGEVTIPEQTSVGQLATMLGQHPSRIIVDLLELGVYSCVMTQLEFRSIYKVARKYGYKAKHAA
jgi:hypothetical protein